MRHLSYQAAFGTLHDMNAIFAIDTKYGFGMNDGSLPWYNKADLRYFKQMTSGGVRPQLICGRKTYESMPVTKMNERSFIILSSSLNQVDVPGNCTVVRDFKEAYLLAHRRTDTNEIWLIGGKTVFEKYLCLCNQIFVSYVHSDIEADIKFDFREYLLEKFITTLTTSTKEYIEKHKVLHAVYHNRICGLNPYDVFVDVSKVLNSSLTYKEIRSYLGETS